MTTLKRFQAAITASDAYVSEDSSSVPVISRVAGGAGGREDRELASALLASRDAAAGHTKAMAERDARLELEEKAAFKACW